MISTRDIVNIPYVIGDKLAVVSLNVEVYEQLQEWEMILNNEQEELSEEQIKIKNEFLEADKIIPTLSTISQKHQDSLYIRQPISTKLINTLLNTI
ncbi:13012_t:CDS:2 [Dentiscutata heterogama]|uniref:13012_t:CDS:1 n=1 Tax=Dentiscutata heterogama TaxID=1316150 RepID=A0ACA9MLA7_9GLOM|nr:13012_t:CDS:2 [Dentiscutata heterogama]